MTTQRYESVGDLPRNDVPSAVNLYRRKRQAGTWSPEDGQMLIMLQDDPAELFDAIERVEDELDRQRPPQGGARGPGDQEED